MNALSNELKGVISRHVQLAGPEKILVIASALCTEDAPVSARPLTLTITDVRERFEILDDDQVRDHSNGLIWTRKDVSSETMNFKDAQAACEKLRFGGSSGWRLPTIGELLSLVDYERHDPAIDTSVFACKPSWYWTSTALNSSPGVYAWSVDFSGGYSSWNDRSNFGWVRAVRVGQF